MSHDASRAGHTKGRWRVYLPSVIALVVVVLSCIFVEQLNRSLHSQGQSYEVREAAGLIRSQLEGTIRADVQLVLGLVAVLENQPDISQEEFSNIAARTIGNRVQFRNVAVAPGFVVSLVHPFSERNQRVIGLNYATDPIRGGAVKRMQASGQFQIAGPIDLIVGGQGVIGRFPMFSEVEGERTIWGLMSAVINAESIYEQAGLRSGDHGLKIAIRGRNGLGADGDVFFGSEDVFASDPVLIDVELPVGSWQLAAVPANGWTPLPDNIWFIRAAMVGVGLAIFLPTLVACHITALRNQVIRALQTREVELQNNRAEVQRLSLVAQHASDSIILSDRNARVTWVNPAFEEVTGYAREEILGKRPAEFLNGPDTDPATIKLIAEAISEGKRVQTEILNYKKSGEPLWVETHIVPVLDDAGGVQLVIAVERDVTDAKRQKRELAEAKFEAEKADRAKSEFLANMSHEIRTPMNGIMGMAELLQEAELPKKAFQQVSVIHESSKGLLQIINDILDLSRLEAGKLEISDRDFNLRECIGGIVDLMGSAARKKRLELTVHLSDDLPTVVRSDDGRMRQVLLNLLGNAVKFTNEGSVQLSVRPDSADPYRLVFDIADTGLGMSQEQVQAVFDRFSQADAAITRNFGGSGLGLTISRHLAEQMGGTISVVSELHQGSVFTLEIQTAAALGGETTTKAAVPVDCEIVQGCRILLAEDNATNRLLVHKYLSDLDVDLFDAVDGQEAIDQFLAKRPDVILMDMSMPKIDGLEATRTIRSMSVKQPVIIALTANAFESDRKACLDAGMDTFLSKPLKKSDLIETIAFHAVLKSDKSQFTEERSA